jgi:hypothetical protein
MRNSMALITAPTTHSLKLSDELVGESELVNRRRTDNTKTKQKRTKVQTMFHKTAKI